MNLSLNFTLHDFTRSIAADSGGFKEQMIPPDEVIDNLKNLCENLLQPLADHLPGSIIVTSGYRCERLNKAVKGAINSQHLKGQAADIQYYENRVMANQKLIDKVRELKLEYDQMIAEKTSPTTGEPRWVHLSYKTEDNRNQFLKT